MRSPPAVATFSEPDEAEDEEADATIECIGKKTSDPPQDPPSGGFFPSPFQPAPILPIPQLPDLGTPFRPPVSGGPAGAVGCDWGQARLACINKWSYMNPGKLCPVAIKCTPIGDLCEMRPSCPAKAKVKLVDGKIKEVGIGIGGKF